MSFGLEGRPKIRRACLNRSDSTLNLQWNRPSDNCLSFTHFNLYGRDNPLSIYQLLGTYTDNSINSLNRQLPNTKQWEFFLVFHKACNGVDSIYSDTVFIDNQAPSNSELDSVSVDFTTQKAIVGWSKNAALDVEGYYIYNVTGSGLNTIISTTSSLNYTDNDRNPVNGSISYKIAALDSCKNASLISEEHRTIHLQSTYNPCNKTINLQWTPYIGWEVDNYDIYLKIDASNFALIGTVISNITQFTYTFSNFGSTYCFYVRAHKKSSSITSSSNITCNATNNIRPSDNSYIAKVSVINEVVEFVGVVQPNSSAERINIFKREGNGNYFLWRTEELLNPAAGAVIRIIDEDVKVHLKTYSYFFNTEGACDLIFDSSQIATTILLNVMMIEPGDQTLNWNPYTGFIKFTENQQVLLSSDQNYNYSSTWNILNTLGSGIFNYQDFTTVSITQDKICYAIRAIENNSSPPFIRKDTSYSNVQCVTADPIVYFPNAIQINGFNTVFYPKGVFIDYTQSYFQVYDRWGQIIYETNDIRKGWDGTANGEFVQSDVYAYRAVIVGLNGKVLNFDGTITVLK